MILEVTRDSPAGEISFKKGDVVREVNGVTIDSTETMKKVAQDNTRRWYFAIERDGRILQQSLIF